MARAGALQAIATPGLVDSLRRCAFLHATADSSTASERPGRNEVHATASLALLVDARARAGERSLDLEEHAPALEAARDREVRPGIRKLHSSLPARHQSPGSSADP